MSPPGVPNGSGLHTTWPSLYLTPCMLHSTVWIWFSFQVELLSLKEWLYVIPLSWIDHFLHSINLCKDGQPINMLQPKCLMDLEYNFLDALGKSPYCLLGSFQCHSWFVKYCSKPPSSFLGRNSSGSSLECLFLCFLYNHSCTLQLVLLFFTGVTSLPPRCYKEVRRAGNEMRAICKVNYIHLDLDSRTR